MSTSSPKSQAIGSIGSLFNHGQNFWGEVLLSPGTIADCAIASETWKAILAFHGSLVTDEYTAYTDAYYRAAHQRYGSHWHYWDIINVLYASAKLIQPRNYLEIGVRRGRSLCTVIRACPTLDVTAFDLWMPGYAGMENPGPTYVQEQARIHGHTGTLTFFDGDSRQTVPSFFQQNPNTTFDLITVDGDHSTQGAWTDLTNVIDHISLGGVLVFDDITHPSHPELYGVWKKLLENRPNFQSFAFGQNGYGIGFAIRVK